MAYTIYRKAYQKLLEWKNRSVSSKAILIEGARRVGKSSLIEEFAKNEYRSYILIDFSGIDKDVLNIFEHYANRMKINEFFNQLSVIYSTPLYEHQSAIIFDEVQKYPKAREFIKHLVADNRYDYIETGSLISIKQNVKDIIIPSEETRLKLYPLDFEEFLNAIGDTVTIPFLKERYEQHKPLGNILKNINEKLRTYMIIGGMPQAVTSYLSRMSYADAEFAKQEILNLYREDIAKYAGNYTGEARAIFDAIPSMLSHHDKKIKFSSLGFGDRYSAAFANAVYWLQDSMVGNLCYCVEDPSLFDGFMLDTTKMKCYMADTGLLLSLSAGKDYLTDSLYKSFVLGKLSVNQGMMTENIVAQMLTANNNPLRFFESIHKTETKKTKYEVDFFIKKNKKITAIEVKSGNAKLHSSLDYFHTTYKVNSAKPIVLTKGDYKETENYIFMPLVMSMFI